ncbi:MAG: OsmC family protein [Bryobacterales bacterium]|jgi:uncharacterized OsmC-like protein|nr:OsmC family protein [Bryobacterales bacterium]
MTATTVDPLRTTIERNIKALSLRPGIGQGTAVTTVHLRDGVACDVEEGAWTLRTDLGVKSGGRNEAPNPGILGRAALGSCLAAGYAMWAARYGIPLTSLEVVVEADYDSRGLFGVDGVPPGYKEIRYTVRISSPAAEAEVRRMIEDADLHSDFLYVFREPQSVTRTIEIERAS